MKPKNTLRNLFFAAATLGFICSAHAAILFNDSFDYGSTTNAIRDVSNWTSTSGVLNYDANNNLTNPNVASSGGSMWLNFNDSRSASNITDFTTLDLSTTAGFDTGGTVWMMSLNQFVSGNSSHEITIPGGTVSGMGFTITSAGNVSVRASKSGAGNNNEATGLSALSSGNYMMLLSYTKGSPSNSPTNSIVNLWINPTDASSESALGTPDWSFSSSLWGRDGNSLTSITATPSQQGRIDEIRVTTSFAELGLIPEPTTALLGGIGFLFLLRRRR